jgi:hypothetical protein
MSERNPPEISFSCWLFKVTAKGHGPVRTIKRPIVIVLLAMPVVFLLVGLKADLPALNTLKSYVPNWTCLNSLGRQ